MLIGLLCVFNSASVSVQSPAAFSAKEWTQFKSHFGKSYPSREEEEAGRQVFFCQNLKWIEATNGRNLSFRVGLNQFSDQADHEIATSSDMKLDFE